MIARSYDWYNLTNLDDGIMFTDRFRPLEDILKRTRKWYDLVGVIGNEHLELSMFGGINNEKGE